MNIFRTGLLYTAKWKHHLIIAGVISWWIWVFLFFTEPLDVRELSYHEKLQFLFGYALMLFISYSLTIPFQHILYARLGKKWNAWAELLTLLVLSGLMYSISYAFYRLVVVPNEPNPHTAVFFFTNRFMPVFAVVVPILWMVRWVVGIANIHKDDSIVQNETWVLPADFFITLQGVNQKEVLKIKPQQLIYLEAADNYVKINYLMNGKIEQVLFRNKLSLYEKSFLFLIKTHRSYLVNPDFFLRLKQEGRRTFVLLNVEEIEVPVSKNFLADVKARFLEEKRD